jgi:hypothetical protein
LHGSSSTVARLSTASLLPAAMHADNLINVFIVSLRLNFMITHGLLVKDHCLTICDSLLLMIIEFVIINLRILIWLNRNNLCIRDITIDHKRYCSVSNRLIWIYSTYIANSGFISFFKISSTRFWSASIHGYQVNDGDIRRVTSVHLRSSLTMVHGEDSLQKISCLPMYSFPRWTQSGSHSFYLHCLLEPNIVYVSAIFNI